MGRLLPIRAVALIAVAAFGFHMSRFYLAADLTNIVCPHHVQPMGMETEGAHEAQGSVGSVGSMQHGNHTMPQSKQSHQGTQPGSPGSNDSGMRCCCRHSLDGLVTTLVLFGPADMANVPLPDGIQVVSLASDLSVLQNDLNPPFIPPRV